MLVLQNLVEGLMIVSLARLQEHQDQEESSMWVAVQEQEEPLQVWEAE